MLRMEFVGKLYQAKGCEQVLKKKIEKRTKTYIHLNNFERGQLQPNIHACYLYRSEETTYPVLKTSSGKYIDFKQRE